MSTSHPASSCDLVTVVITTKDRPDMLRRSIRSVKNQTHQNLELIVVDDGSMVPVSLAAFNDHPAKTSLIRNDSSVGACAARNRGLEVANGNWIAFLDDDDELAANMVEQSLAAAQISRLPPPVAVLTTMQVIDDEGVELKRRVPPTLPLGSGYFLSESQKGRSWLAQNSLLAPTAVLQGMGGWDPELGAAEHTDFFLRLNDVCSIEGIEDVGYLYHDHASQHLNQNFLKTALDMEKTLQKHWRQFLGNRRRMARYAGSCGYFFLRANRWWRSIRWCGIALWSNPRQGRLWLYFFAALAGPFARRLIRKTNSQVSATAVP